MPFNLPMEKSELVHCFVEKISRDLAAITQAALATYEGATHAEMKAEDQYDTRGIEASYLAGAQSKRAMELQEVLAIFRYTDLLKFDENTPIASTALIELDCEGKRSYCFLMPKGGGQSVQFEGKTIQSITPQSPLGESLLGRKVGDSIEVEINRVTRDYEIISVN